VTYSTAAGAYRIYGEREVNELIEELKRADLVVGFNTERFDFEVLQATTSSSTTAPNCARSTCSWT
jgi:DEAD/DEAH box helicase domain-containing protein